MKYELIAGVVICIFIYFIASGISNNMPGDANQRDFPIDEISTGVGIFNSHVGYVPVAENFSKYTRDSLYVLLAARAEYGFSTIESTLLRNLFLGIYPDSILNQRFTGEHSKLMVYSSADTCGVYAGVSFDFGENVPVFESDSIQLYLDDYKNHKSLRGDTGNTINPHGNARPKALE
jgi:hypothetical protein